MKKYIELRIYLDMSEDELNEEAEAIKDDIQSHLEYDGYPVEDVTYQIKEKE